MTKKLNELKKVDLSNYKNPDNPDLPVDWDAELIRWQEASKILDGLIDLLNRTEAARGKSNENK